jgi:hypothetical protein
LNLRPSGYEPDELPDCSTPQQRARIVRGPWRTLQAVKRRRTFYRPEPPITACSQCLGGHGFFKFRRVYGKTRAHRSSNTDGKIPNASTATPLALSTVRSVPPASMLYVSEGSSKYISLMMRR